MTDSPENRINGSDSPADQPHPTADTTGQGASAQVTPPAANGTPAVPDNTVPDNAPSGPAASSYAPPLAQNRYAPTQSAQDPTGQNPYSQPTGPYTPPVPGSVPPAFGQTPTPTGSYNPYANAPKQEKTPAERARRTTTVGLIAALAVGALVGGVSGAGVVAAVMSSSQGGSSASNQAPTNITVNDAAEVTTITAVAASAGPSVVTISVSDGAGAGGTGSGVILSEDGYVLTNAHVVTLDGATATPTVSVQTSSGSLYEATVVGTDPISDLAVIKVDGVANFQPASFADSSKLNVGDTAVAIGAPLGLSNTVTNGIISSLNRSITVASSAAPKDTAGESAPSPADPNQGPFDFWKFDTPGGEMPTAASSTIALTVIQTDAAINPGNSGGALLDSDGKVIGINVAIASAGGSSAQSTAGSIGVGFAVPANLAQRIAKEIIETGTGTHGLLGAAVSDASIETSTTVGALIQEISPSGAAEAAGLRAGDVVTAINDLPVTGKTDLTAQVRALAAGSEAKVTYQRDGKSNTADVTLGAMS